jgi:hypothetical protein
MAPLGRVGRRPGGEKGRPAGDFPRAPGEGERRPLGTGDLDRAVHRRAEGRALGQVLLGQLGAEIAAALEAVGADHHNLIQTLTKLENMLV